MALGRRPLELIAPRAFLPCASFVALSALSCGGAGSGASSSDPKSAGPLVGSCRVALAPPTATPMATTAPAPYEAQRSLVIVDVALPLHAIETQVEGQVPTRVAEEHDVDIGIAGRLEYTIDRGKVSARVDGDALVIETPVVAHAKACAKGSCYAGCDPEGRFSLRVRLRLGADYKLHAERAHVDITRKCVVSAGFVSIDATPAIAARLPAAEKSLTSSIDQKLPSFKADAETAWKNLSAPRALPFGACVVLAPEGIVQGRASGGESALLHFGLRARPELRGACGDAPKVPDLPPLERDDALPAEGDVHFATVFASAAVALEGTSFVFTSPEAWSNMSHIEHASGSAQALDLTLGGEACGEVHAGAMRAKWDDDQKSVTLVGVSLFSGEAERFAKAGLDPNVVSSAIAGAKIPVPISPADLAAMLPDVAKSASDAHASVSAHVSSSVPESAGLRGESLVAVSRLRGAVRVDVK